MILQMFVYLHYLQDILYVLLVARGSVITLVRPKKHSVHPSGDIPSNNAQGDYSHCISRPPHSSQHHPCTCSFRVTCFMASHMPTTIQYEWFPPRLCELSPAWRSRRSRASASAACEHRRAREDSWHGRRKQYIERARYTSSQPRCISRYYRTEVGVSCGSFFSARRRRICEAFESIVHDTSYICRVTNGQ